MASWEHTLELDAPAAEAFALLIQTARRVEWSPPAWGLALVDGPDTFTVGSSLHWTVRRSGLTQRLHTEITALEPPARIVEEQRRGPLRRWVQTTRLEPLPGARCRLTELVDFEPPGGLLGLAVKAADVVQQLEEAAAHRDAQLREHTRGRRRIGGIVLCGGQSRRMGRPKAWLPFGDELLLPRMLRLLGTAAWPLVAVAARDQALPALPAEVLVVRDPIPGRGPLEGLAAGLRALEGRADVTYLASCDTPFLHPTWVARLAGLMGDHRICVPLVGDYHHPLAALYHLDVLAAVERLLQADRLRPVFLFDEVPTRVVSATELADLDPDFRTLRNLNTPEDYEAALRDAGLRNAGLPAV